MIKQQPLVILVVPFLIVLIFNPLGGDMKDEKNRITPVKNHLIDQKGLSFKNHRFDKLLWVQLLIFRQTAEKKILLHELEGKMTIS